MNYLALHVYKLLTTNNIAQYSLEIQRKLSMNILVKVDFVFWPKRVHFLTNKTLKCGNSNESSQWPHFKLFQLLPWNPEGFLLTNEQAQGEEVPHTHNMSGKMSGFQGTLLLKRVHLLPNVFAFWSVKCSKLFTWTCSACYHSWFNVRSPWPNIKWDDTLTKKCIQRSLD